MTHYTPSSREIEKNIEVISGLQSFAHEAVDTFLLQSETAWQPADFLPDMSKPLALNEVKELQERAATLPAAIITSLVGNMITEEALPTYQTYFNLIKGVNEERNVASDNGWVKWSRHWTAEKIATATCSTNICISPAAPTCGRWKLPFTTCFQRL